MAKRRHRRYYARGPALADNRPPILPVTLSVSDSATLKLLQVSPPSFETDRETAVRLPVQRHGAQRCAVTGSHC